MIDKILRNIEKHEWRYAKSMPKYPHWYTLREDWNDKDFVEFVLFIRKHGYKDYFWGKEYVKLNINGYQYWTMGCPIHNCSKTGTILINRAKVKYQSDYDQIADVYDKLFKDVKYRKAWETKGQLELKKKYYEQSRQTRS